MINFFELKSAAAFKQAGFFSLENNASSALGDDLIDKIQVELRPGQGKSYHLSLSNQTAYIGIVAAYRNIDQATWRVVIPLPPLTQKSWLAIINHRVRIHVVANSQGIEAQLER